MKNHAGTPLSRRIKALRIEKGITQKQLSHEIGVSYGSIVDYENGRREPNSKAMAALERFFHVSGDYLRGETDRAIQQDNTYKENGGERLNSLLLMFQSQYKTSSQEEQRLATSILEQVLELLCNNILPDGAAKKFNQTEILGLLTAIFSLNGAGRTELNKRAQELKQLSQYQTENPKMM